MNKKSWFWSTRNIVILYAIIVFIIAACQCIIGMIPSIEIKNQILMKFLNGELVLPISELAYCWVAIVAAYIGVDRTAYALKSANMESGTNDIGNASDLRTIIVITGILFFAVCISSFFTKADLELPQFATAFGSSIILYVAGQKAIRCTKYINGKADKNNNGIPDEDEDEYFKWARSQRKDGVEERFINYDYFCDERKSESEKEKKEN